MKHGKIMMDNEGYYFMSKHGIRYEMLEGVSIEGIRKCTSDILFIFLMNSDYNVSDHYVGYMCGANLISTHLEEYEKYIDEVVVEYEERELGYDK